jgi:hypothetical protein
LKRAAPSIDVSEQQRVVATIPLLKGLGEMVMVVHQALHQPCC